MAKYKPEDTPSLQEMIDAFTECGSLRGAGRKLGISHNMIKAHFVKNNIEIMRKEKKSDAVNNHFNLYLRPSQIEALEEVTRLENSREGRDLTMHERGRMMIDEALTEFLDSYQPKVFNHALRNKAVA